MPPQSASDCHAAEYQRSTNTNSDLCFPVDVICKNSSRSIDNRLFFQRFNMFGRLSDRLRFVTIGVDLPGISSEHVVLTSIH